MSFLSTLQEFGGKWEEISREKLSKEELKNIKSITVAERHSKDGEAFNVMVFTLKSGKTKSAYLSKLSDLEVGNEVDPKSVEFIYLERDGEPMNEPRADGEAL